MLTGMDAIALMATAMHAEERRLEIFAANLANASTDGFQKRVARTTLSDNGLITTPAVDDEPGALRHTGRNFDLSTAGPGGFFVRERGGSVVATRSASFERNAGGQLYDARGRVLMGETAPITASAEASIDDRGVVRDGGREVGRIRVSPGTVLQTGFLEASNVNAVGEMVDVLSAQRAFESAEKTLAACDQERQKDASDVARVQS